MRVATPRRRAEGRRDIARVAKSPRQGTCAPGKRVLEILSDPVSVRVAGGEETGVRRQRVRHGSDHLGEKESITKNPI